MKKQPNTYYNTRRKRRSAPALTRRQRRPRLAGVLAGLVALVCAGWLVALEVSNREIAMSNRLREQTAADAEQRLTELRKVQAMRESAVRTTTYADLQAASLSGAPADELLRDFRSRTCNFALFHREPARPDVLINKSHCIEPLDATPRLVDALDARLAPEAATAYREMRQDMASSDITVRTTSSYRSFSDQLSIYRSWAIGGSNTAETHSALPGYSEHQLGLAVDMAVASCALECFASTEAYDWLTANAARYGFIERYPRGKESITGYAHEAWHWRYVGRASAEKMKRRSITTLEELWLTGEPDTSGTIKQCLPANNC